jgi:hypothetical protein
VRPECRGGSIESSRGALGIAMDLPSDDADRESRAAHAIAEPSIEDAASEHRRWPRLQRRLVTALGYLAPCLAALALVLVLAGEQANVDDDLRLIAPARATPGERLPLRALLYTHLRATEGPALRRQAIDVVLESATGQQLAHTQLRSARGRILDLEGELTLPDRLGHVRIRAQTRSAGRVIRSAAALHMLREMPEVLPEGRSLRALQQFSEGAVVSEANEVPPSALQVRVRGGACVPEQPCRVLVHVGAPAATLRLEPNSTLTPSAAAQRASQPTAGVVGFDFVTHGPEAELWMTAERQGRRVARRAVRLPVAMGALSVQTRAASWSLEETPSIRVSGAEGSCIVDAFRRGQWLRTGSLAVCDRDNRLPFAALLPGIYRLQVRADPFSAQTAGVTTLYIRAPGETAIQCASTLAHAARKADAADRFAADCSANANADACSEPAALEYLAALLENGIIEAPPAATGYADSLTLLRERQARLRNLSLLALAVGGLSLAIRIGRRGLSAGARARALLLRESRDPEFGRRTRWRSIGLVAASVFSLLLVFVVIALYVLARGSD